MNWLIRIKKGLTRTKFKFKFKFKCICSHLFNYNTTTIRKKRRDKKKREVTIHRIKHNKGKKCVAAKGAKLSSWLLPHSDYKWVAFIQYYSNYYTTNKKAI